MQSHHDDQDPSDLSPKQKKRTVRYITIAIIAFLIFVMLYMFLNVKPEAEELPINTNPSIAETES